MTNGTTDDGTDRHDEFRVPTAGRSETEPRTERLDTGSDSPSGGSSDQAQPHHDHDRDSNT
ncbi:hypothetical protein C493_09308 [Natronolimnohabitans innermongolicus JCM 12255]|uniref:Uncharacterized protein n=1 Tax=Natronolimnohabitans innermongolicus JCM 12255 TaxID=1227499 RepID=L9X5H2_9EURY|nr:hypothetical protein C493_09308 [Natronolimnohabitans innermongolicus JCM 12255]